MEDLNLDSRYDDQQRQAPAAMAKSKKRAVRKEQSALPIVESLEESLQSDIDGVTAGRTRVAEVKITLFESEIDPFDFAPDGQWPSCDVSQCVAQWPAPYTRRHY